jgi:hypothetical protein
MGVVVMCFKKLALLAALCALSAVAFVSSASAVIIEDTTGATLPAGTAIRGTLEAGQHVTLTSTLGNFTCAASSFTMTVGASGGATVTATMAANAFTFSNCTDTMPFVTFSHCGSTHYRGGSVVTGSLRLPGLQLRCDLGGGSVCELTLAATAAGTITNANHTVGMSNVGFTSSGGFCPGTAAFSANYIAVRESNNSGILVT